MGRGLRVSRHIKMTVVCRRSHHSRDLCFQRSEFCVTRVDRGGCFGGKEDGSFRTPAGGAKRLLGRFGSVFLSCLLRFLPGRVAGVWVGPRAAPENGDAGSVLAR